MVGVLIWKEPQSGKRQKNITLREVSILHMRCMQVEILRKPRTPEGVLHHRVLAAEKRLRKLGVTQVVLPEGLKLMDHAEGVAPVSTMPLRQALAADQVRRSLNEKGIRIASARVAVTADRLTGEVVRTVTQLCLRHRYVLLDVPQGGEELCRRLRREYGVSLLLGPDKSQIEGAEALVLFDRREELAGENPAVVILYDESAPLPPLLLPPTLEEKLPRGADRVQLLAALLHAGVIRAGADLTF